MRPRMRVSSRMWSSYMQHVAGVHPPSLRKRSDQLRVDASSDYNPLAAEAISRLEPRRSAG